MDFFFFLFYPSCAFGICFYAGFFAVNREVFGLILTIVLSFLSFPILPCTKGIRCTYWYNVLGIGAAWATTVAITITMTKKPEGITFEPVHLPWVVATFFQMNFTPTWYCGTLSLTGQLSLNFAACYYYYGNTEEILKTAFVYCMLVLMHASVSLQEEGHFREIFYKEITIRDLKESFEGTLEALPEPLIVKTRGNTVCSNSAVKTQLGQDAYKEEVEKILYDRENPNEPEGENQEAPKKVKLGQHHYWHSLKQLTWNNMISCLHLFVNVTADHELTLQKAANRYMHVMLGSVTHELRTPLNSSTTAIEMLEGRLPPELEKHLKTAKTSNKMLRSLIEDILDLTRLEFGRFELNKERFRIKDIVDLLHELFHDQMGRKGIQLIFDVRAEALNTRIFSDPRRIQQVLVNLVANALKFTFAGFVRVVIAFIAGAVRFEVNDSGVGINEESLPNLFKLFGKLKETEDINKTGCGIGLHISQEIVTRLGGRILVESEENRGSTFMFDLPLEEEAVQEEEILLTEQDLTGPSQLYMQAEVLNASVGNPRPSTTRYSITEEEKISFTDKLIVAVDDQPMNIDVLEMVLVKKLDRDVICCSSGEEAIREIRRIAQRSEGRPLELLVLMDINMPLMDGIEATKRIKNLLESFKNTRAIYVALTAQEERFVKDAHIFDEFKTKPATKNALESLLRKFNF